MYVSDSWRSYTKIPFYLVLIYKMRFCNCLKLVSFQRLCIYKSRLYFGYVWSYTFRKRCPCSPTAAECTYWNSWIFMLKYSLLILIEIGYRKGKLIVNNLTIVVSTFCLYTGQVTLFLFTTRELLVLFQPPPLSLLAFSCQPLCLWQKFVMFCFFSSSQNVAMTSWKANDAYLISCLKSNLPFSYLQLFTNGRFLLLSCPHLLHYSCIDHPFWFW